MGGNLMSSRISVGSILVPCLLAVGLLSNAPAASAAPTWLSILKSGESAKSHVIAIADRRLRPLPIAPSYEYYDYPYEYSVGRYPTHIGRGFVYFGYPYKPKYGGNRCSLLDRKCLASRGYYGGPGSSRRQKARKY